MAESIGEVMRKMLQGVRAKPNEGDFYNEDGLLCCGRCGEPREVRVPIPGTENVGIFGGMCRCEREKDDERRRRDEAARLEREKRANRARCFDIGDMAGCTFASDDSRDREASETCRAYVDTFEASRAKGHGILMTGEFGCGKTFLAGCVANALLDRGYRVKFTSLSFLNGRITRNYGNAGPIIDMLRECDLVIFDDLGTERRTSTANENAYQIVNALYEDRVPMVFTTNIPAKEISTDANPDNARIYSRIIGRCKPLKVRGEDRRKETENVEWDF